ncbi:MAG: assimilatory sulfite reductase (NADPH) flavoprotein subunit [Gammaproteobacteria bacterium]|nr:assimilatory sulfite reductase (NADPH) flavoprotein subunit [Gammaproteobacteria bacterium]MBU2059421.1 assimilatory sulfite reductase (NADPH) flavoprotein subunit [Gammaproteobacteria bacterium]MBU2175199.1 assimilatory sulfite reductase (NADPH) flavoprotein subunit [Gammaproteobacteria bacterium]MBU2247407.1 assimilatory sulfite reductase (NADPH) flavoprotein subunit [Gammaproteobacteria bacterium]MBU2346326.1 assimilatory sulfite reductase (NADPH) flavoprotein subunit [Gammaproteobacteria
MLFASLAAQASPLSAQQIKDLQSLVSQLNPIQQAWVSGYLAAAAQLAGGQAPLAAQQGNESAVLTILYGSQTGNAKAVASKIKAAAEQQGMSVKLTDIGSYKTTQLAKEKYLLIVTSTYGEGEPPESAVAFHKFLFSKKAPKLDGLQYAVLGLGDTSYEFFCKTAIDFDEQLAALGAKRLHARADLDVDYAALAASWTETAVQAFAPELKQSAGNSAEVIAWPGATATAGHDSAYNKETPYLAELSVNQKITGRDSTKDVRHIEISLADSGITYQPGDALGVYFLNDDKAVDAILAATGLNGATQVQLAGQTYSLRTALTEQLELTQSYPSFVEKYAQATANSELLELVKDKTALRQYLDKRQTLDVILQNPAPLTAQQLVDALRKQQPRLYSIASSQAEVGDEVHLTLGVVRYDAFGSTHLGGASGFLAERLEEGAALKVFVEHNDNFRLPDHETPVIMIGPGTGIAPFRAFLQERDQAGATGQNWLFFGNPHFTQDFLYQVELQDYLKRGVLSKLDVAFSRDQAQKVYVQDKLRLKAEEIWTWLQQGAYLYICGDGNKMAKDVHQALLDIAQQQAGFSAEEAEQYFDDLRQAKRYQKDVY